MSRRRIDWAALGWVLLIVGASFVVYGRSLGLFFSQDDFFFLLRASRLASVGDFLRSLAAPDHFYRPVPRAILFPAELWLFGLHPGGFHLVSLGLHAGNAVLLFLLGRRLSGGTPVSGLAGLFFAGHQVPFLAVYWPSGVQDLCMTTFALLSVHFYLRFVQAKQPGWWAASLLAFALALLSKETAVTLPLTLLLAGWVAARSPARKRRWVREAAWHTAGYALVLGLYLLLRSSRAAAGISGEGPYAWAFSPAVVLQNLYTYMCDALFVRGGALPSAPTAAPAHAAWACGTFVALLLSVLVASRRYRAVTAFGAAWFLISLLPLLFLSERAYSFYSYLALAGIALAAAVLPAGVLRWIAGAAPSPSPAADRPGRRPGIHTRRGARRPAAAILALALAGGWLWFGSGQVRVAEATDPIGIVAKSVTARQALAEVRALYPTLKAGSTLCVEGLTERDYWAVGRGDMFRLYYPHVTVIVVPTDETAGGVAGCPGSAYLFRFRSGP